MKLPPLNQASILRHTPKERVITFLRREFPGHWFYRPSYFDWVRPGHGKQKEVVARMESHTVDEDSFDAHLYVGPPYDQRIFWRGAKYR